MALFSGGLLPASFRGVPFGVEADAMSGGRRLAVHIYPGRDKPWAEDMGRAPRTFSIRGFIVDNDVLLLGGPIQLQRALLLAALEKSGPGTLTHPTIGVLQVSVTRFTLGQGLDASSTSSVDIEFVEAGTKTYPSLLTSSSGLLSAATLCDVAIALDFARVAVLALGAGSSGSDAAPAAQSWTASVNGAAADATAAYRVSARLPGNFGRYSVGANAGFVGSATTIYDSATTVANLIADGSAAREAVAAAGMALTTALDAATTDTLPTVSTAAAALIAALVACCADPADAIRLLLDLAANPPGTQSAIGGAVTALFLRTVGVALARVCAAYQPSSYDDAFQLLAKVAALLDQIAITCADAGDDASFASICKLKAAVVADLRARGANLARVRTVSVGLPLPALVLGQQLYRDPSRADELIDEAGPISPLFMPVQFQALAA